MFYFAPTLIDAMARSRLSRPGQVINLDMNDYRMFVAEREVVCAIRVKSESEFPEFISELRSELYNAQSDVDEPIEVMVHLIVHPEADVTTSNYTSLGRRIQKVFGNEIMLKIGFGSDRSLPDNYKDIMVFVAGN